MTENFIPAGHRRRVENIDRANEALYKDLERGINAYSDSDREYLDKVGRDGEIKQANIESGASIEEQDPDTEMEEIVAAYEIALESGLIIEEPDRVYDLGTELCGEIADLERENR